MSSRGSEAAAILSPIIALCWGVLGVLLVDDQQPVVGAAVWLLLYAFLMWVAFVVTVRLPRRAFLLGPLVVLVLSTAFAVGVTLPFALGIGDRSLNGLEGELGWETTLIASVAIFGAIAVVTGCVAAAFGKANARRPKGSSPNHVPS